ncbi:MAG: sodium:solute symporter family protein [Balneolaceae bacterium]|nr:sodium:solute symporter family protein [Balneolaceae bacterium]MBO6547305.1 sodium:solute symporter family protein [Balneolaceae bacterium]MBO6647748.1 sodium:solute symporter family protein [Balneolaceae bacterium]
MSFLGIHLLDWFILGIYISVITAIGLYSNKAVKSTGDYFMGGRRFGKLLMIAQAFGAGTRADQAVAVIGASSQIGLAGIWYQWLYLFSTPFYWLIAPIYRRLRYITIGDFFEKRYGTSMGAAYAVVGLLWFAANIGVVLKGTGVTIEAITGGQISTEMAVFGMVAFFVLYGLLGGLVAAASTQLIQGFFILLLSFMLIPFALNEAGGITQVREFLPDDWFSLVANQEVTLFFIIMAILNGMVGVVVQPHHMAINGSGKTEINCRSGWTYGTFIKRFATLGWAFSGIFIAVVFPSLIEADASEREQAFGLAISNLLPSGFIGLMIAALVAAVVAACNNFMVNGSALFTRNFYKRFLNQKADQQHYLTIARISSFFVVAIGVGIALYIPSVVEGLFLIWKIMAFLGIAFWMAVFWKKANRYGAWSSMIITAVLAFTTDFYGWSFPEQVALYLPIGFATMITVSFFTKSEDEERLNIFYSLLNTPVGHENRLEKAGISISDDELPASGSEKVELLDNKIALENGEGLILVDLLKLRKKFSYKNYKVDLKGFGISWVIVIGYLLLAFGISQLI